MSTKVSVLSEMAGITPFEPEKSRIEFIKGIAFTEDKASSREPLINPDGWKNVILLAKDYARTGKDLMFAYDNIPKQGMLYLGHFNDGIV